jgi:hypothetical protein
MNHSLFLFVPLVGYAGLWLLASPLFVLYFKLFHVAMDLKHTVRMVKQVPAVLAIVTVPVCSFVSFWATTKITVHMLHSQLTTGQALQVGLVSLAVTVVLDVLITVLGEKIDIRKFPLDLMYLLAYLVIVPAVVVGR